MRRIGLVACALGMIAAVLAAPASAFAEPAAAIVDGTTILVRFDTAHPGTITSALPVTGLGEGERLEDLDYRWHPNGELNPQPPPQLFALAVKPGLAYEARLYTIDLATGAATPLGPLAMVTAGNVYGIDFNPAVDRIRVVNDLDYNIRLNPNNGTVAGVDTPLNPTGAKIAAVAYDEAGISVPPPPAVAPTAYAIATGAPNDLYTLGGPHGAPSPNSGQLLNGQPLGVPLVPSSPSGFDISPTGAAYAVLNGFGLYTIDLTTGSATLVGNTPDRLRGLAIVPEPTPPPPPDTEPPSVTLAGARGSTSFAAFLKGVSVKVTPSEPAALDGTLLASARSARLSSFNLTLATKSLGLGEGQRTLKLKPGKRLLGHPKKKFKVQLRVTATDAAGNERTVTKTIAVKPPRRKR